MRKSSLQKRTESLQWDDLRCVLTIARTGTLNGAARALGIEHSTVFRRLNEIEKRLGVKLFERARSGYVPTSDGEFAAAAASAMELEALAIERRMLGAGQQLAGVIRLATSELFASFLLPAVLDEFMTAHPGVEIEVDASSRLVDLTRREADIALRATAEPPERLIGQSLGEIRYAIYGAASMTTADTLDSLPWLGFDQTISYMAIARWQRDHTQDRRSRIRFNSLAAMLHAAAHGVGLAILPLFAADHLQPLKRLSAVLEEPRMKLWVLTQEDMRANARVRAFARHLARRIPGVLTAQQQLG